MTHRLTLGWKAELLVLGVGAIAGLILGLLIRLGSPEFTLREMWKAVGSAMVIVLASRAVVLLGTWLYQRRASGDDHRRG